MKLQQVLRRLSITLAFIVFALVAERLHKEWLNVQVAQKGRTQLQTLNDFLIAAGKVSRERGPANAMLSHQQESYTERQVKLQLSREASNEAFDRLAAHFKEDTTSSRLEHRVYLQAAARLELARAHVNKAIETRSTEDIRIGLNHMFGVIKTLEPGMLSLANDVQHAFPNTADAVQAAVLAARLRENAGELGSYFTVALADSQRIQPLEHDAIRQTRGRIAEQAEMLNWRIEPLMSREKIRNAWNELETHYFETALPYTENLEKLSATHSRYPVDTAGFAAQYAPELESIVALRNTLMATAMEEADAELAKSRREAITVAFACVLVFVVLLTTKQVLKRRIMRPLRLGERLITSIAQGRVDQKIPHYPYQDEVASLLNAIGVLQENSRVRLQLENERATLIEQLQHLSNTDPLTQLPNRRCFYEYAERERPVIERQQYPLSLAIFDIDYFKRVNDTHGHAVGDAVLIAVAQLCKASVRRGDIVARFGGEEFVVWMPYCTLEQAQIKAEALRAAIEKLSIPLPEGDTLHVTASFGVVQWRSEYTAVDQAISEADELLYAAKAAGRNRVFSEKSAP